MVYQAIPNREGEDESSPYSGRPIMRVMFVMDSSSNQEEIGFENLLNRLMEMHQPRSQPTSQEFIESLPEKEVDENNKLECPSCTVCFDEFEIGSTASCLPCKHQFHKECISPWLSEHNTCPICRFSLPTEVTPLTT
jgi:protein-arginine kinase activator protein McsA